jgi:hypothetical protein
MLPREGAMLLSGWISTIDTLLLLKDLGARR